MDCFEFFKLSQWRKIKYKGLNLNNDIKQRAEQLKKNAEAKIQKAQIKEQKYQQDLEFQKKE